MTKLANISVMAGTLIEFTCYEIAFTLKTVKKLIRMDLLKASWVLEKMLRHNDTFKIKRKGRLSPKTS